MSKPVVAGFEMHFRSKQTSKMKTINISSCSGVNKNVCKSGAQQGHHVCRTGIFSPLVTVCIINITWRGKFTPPSHLLLSKQPNGLYDEQTEEWLSKQMHCNKTGGRRRPALSIYPFGFMLSEAELSCWKQSSRKQDLSQDTWGGKQQRERESWFEERKEKLATIWSLRVWLTPSYWLMAPTLGPVVRWLHTVVA